MDHRPMGMRLLARLRRETNGAAVAAMEAKGLHYKYSYGVALHSIRSAAKVFAPDSGFAEYLWRQPVRELRLAAPTVADPVGLAPDKLGFWFDGAENMELAENLASFLLSKSGLIAMILESYGRSDDVHKRYAALLSVAKGDMRGIPAGKIAACAEDAARSGSPMLIRAAALMLANAAAYEDKRAEVENFIRNLESSADENLRMLFNQLIT